MTNYVAKLEGQIVGTRKSDRTYTHAVIIQYSEEWHRERAHSVAYAQYHNSKSNFDYYSEIAARGVEGELAQWRRMSRETADRIVAMGYDAWVEGRRLENIKQHEASVANGGFKPAVLCWNGRRDLADKEAAKRRAVASIAQVWVVEAEEVEKLPKVKGERKHAAYGPQSN